MRGLKTGCWLLVVLVLMGAPAVSAQSIVTEGNIETGAQLVSSVATGTPPLAVSSTTVVPSLNADQLDGMDSSAFAQETDLTSAEVMLVALQAQLDALGLALVPRTGQATCYDAAGAVTTCGTGIGLGQDGHLQLGVTWPNPRFTKNGDGTVTDNLTGLIWLETADCAATTMDWAAALAFGNTLFDGSTAHNGGDCGLSDGSVVGQWRLPNRFELESLLDLEFFNPALSNGAGTVQWTDGDVFSGVQSAFYWSSTTFASLTLVAWGVSVGSGSVSSGSKTGPSRVWLVRTGQ